MYDHARAIATGLITSALFIAACGSGSKGPGVAGTGGSSGSKKGSALAYSRCMRSHGIQMPDPQPPSSGPQSQSTRSGGNGPNIDPNSPQFKNAQQACQSLLPKGKGGFSTHEAGGGK